MENLLQDRMMMGGMALFAYVISSFSIPVIIRAAKKRNLFDHPDYSRKIHSESIPTLGGIAIFVAFLLSFSVSSWSEDFTGFSYLVAALLVLFFVGLKDDLVTLSAKIKLGAQISAVGLVMYGSGIIITDFHGMLGLGEISLWLALPITLFTVIVVINAVNLIDGIDGLAGGFGVLASLLFSTAFMYVGQWPMVAFSLCLSGALLGFLRYNFSPASIFMGDTGSMLLGFLLSVEAIAFLKLGSVPAFTELFGNAASVLTVAILAFPLYDTLRVVIKRLRRGRSIFSPGQDHVHHELLRMGLSHKWASLTLYALSSLVVGFALVLTQTTLNVNIQLGLVIGACLIIFPTNGFKRSVFSKAFGHKWQRWYSYKWGLQFDQERRIDLLSNIAENGMESNIYDLADKDKSEEEKIAV